MIIVRAVLIGYAALAVYSLAYSAAHLAKNEMRWESREFFR